MGVIDAGLHATDGSAIALRGVEVEPQTEPSGVRVRVRQWYAHDEDAPVEAIYTLQLPPDATLAGFAVTRAGRRVEGAPRGRGAADGIQLEARRADVFTASVGALPPGEEAVVEVVYVQPGACVSLARHRMGHAMWRRGGGPDAALQRLGYASEALIERFLEQRYGGCSIDLAAEELDPALVLLLDEDVCREHHVVPVSKNGATLIVATSTTHNTGAADAIGLLTGYDVQFVPAAETVIDRVVRETFATHGRGAGVDSARSGRAPHGEVDFVRPDAGANDPVAALLARQHASGLWDAPSIGAEPLVRSARVTTRALLTLLDAGVTASHPRHGAQVRGAVEAVVAITPGVASRATAVAKLALAAAWLAAAGHPARGAVAAAIRRRPALSSLHARLGDERALRAWVDRALST